MSSCNTAQRPAAAPAGARIVAFALVLLAFALLAPQAAEAQITFRSAASASARAVAFRAAASAVWSSSAISFVAAGAQVVTATTGASITPGIPAGTQANDFAVLIIAGRPPDTTTPAAPAGWTLRSSSLREVGAIDLIIMTFYKVLAGGDANPSIAIPASWASAGGATGGMSGQIAVWRGVNTVTPFDATDVTGTSAAAGSWAPPAITTATNGAWAVSAVATSAENALQLGTANGFSTPPRMSDVAYDTTVGSDHSIGLDDKLQATAGTSAPMLVWSQSTGATAAWAGITFALRPVQLSINLPAGTIQNDVMIAAVGVQPSTTTITAPTGWTLVRRIDNGTATTNSLAVYRKVAGASEPASYTWTLAGATFAVSGIQSFSDVDATTPIDVENGQATASATTHATPDVTTSVANAMVVTSHTYASSRTWTPPTGMTEAFDQPNGADSATGQSIEGSYVAQAAAGATGAKTATAAGDANRGNAHILALRPATTALTINKPAGTVTDDAMIASVGIQPSSASITPPTGWTLVRRIDNSNSPSNSLAIYSKVAGGSEPASYAWVLGVFTHAVGGIESFSGAHTTAPIDVEDGNCTLQGNCGNTTTSHATPSVTTTVADTMLVTSHSFASSRTWTPPTGMTEAFDVASLTVSDASGQSIEGNWVAQAAIGATGTKTATASGDADVGNAHILALKPPAVTAPGSFNAFETSTAAGAITGVIKTRIAGSAFSLDVVAILSGAQMNSFSNNVKLELLANTGTVGSGYGGDNCPTANSVVQTIASAAIAGGRSTVNFSAVADAYRDVRVRVTFPTSSPTVTSCSTDSFAIRPNTLASFAVTDADWQTAGLTRTLDDVTFIVPPPGGAGKVHKAGRPLSVRATAVNAAGTPATTANYTGAPTATPSTCGSAACTATFGTLTLTTTFVAGQLASDVASYDNVGSFALQLVDSTFASVDAADTAGDCTATGRYVCSATINVGRFVPDHFAVALNAPVFGTKCAGVGSVDGFTYIGQKFDYTTAPVITVTAQGFANNTTTLYNSIGSWFRITSASLTGKSYTAAVGGTPDTSGLPGTDPVIVSSGSGDGTLTFGSGTGLFFTRTTPVAPFNADVSLAINVIDDDGVILATNPARFGTATAGNGISFSDGNALTTNDKQMRFGRLRLQNANGSPLIAMPIPMQTQYWNGSGFVTNTLDNCTTIAAGNIAIGNPQNGLTAAMVSPPAVGGAFNAGIGSLRLPKPTGGASGSVDVAVNLTDSTASTSCTAGMTSTAGANKAYLQGAWCGATYVKDPTARATFGVYRNTDRFIYQRENF